MHELIPAMVGHDWKSDQFGPIALEHLKSVLDQLGLVALGCLSYKPCCSFFIFFLYSPTTTPIALIILRPSLSRLHHCKHHCALKHLSKTTMSESSLVLLTKAQSFPLQGSAIQPPPTVSMLLTLGTRQPPPNHATTKPGIPFHLSFLYSYFLTLVTTIICCCNTKW